MPPWASVDAPEGAELTLCAAAWASAQVSVTTELIAATSTSTAAEEVSPPRAAEGQAKDQGGVAVTDGFSMAKAADQDQVGTEEVHEAVQRG